MAIIKSIKTENNELDCIIFGSGAKNMVMLPGLSLVSVTKSAAAIEEAYKCLQDDFTIYLFDRQKTIHNGCTVSDMAEETVKAINILGLENIYLIGMSQGGMMAQHIAAFYPELVKKLIIASSAARHNDRSVKLIGKWAEYAENKDRNSLNRSIVNSIYCKNTLEQYSDFFAASENSGTEKELSRLAIQAKACNLFDIYDDLDKITCPVLVLGADDDKVFGGEASREIAQKLQCEIYMYKGYGHGVYDEAPDYKDRIKNFFI